MPRMRSTHHPYDISDRTDHVEVRGVRRDDVVEALDLLERVREVQAERAVAARGDLVHAMMASNVSLVPPATVAQAGRLARRRDALLATPVFTHETLGQVRGDHKPSATRTWLARRRQESALFSLSHEGRTLIPAFQLTQEGEPRPELQPIIAALTGSGVRDWALWSWLTSPSSFLTGQVPEILAEKEPERVLRAATRFARPPAA